MSNRVFCAIVAGIEPASIVYQDAATLAFVDLRQPNPGHVLAIPRAHVEQVYDLDAETAARLFQATVIVARAPRASLAPAGLNLSQSNGAAAGQEVPHVHIHLVPRRTDDGLFRMYSERPAYPERAELDALAATIRAAVEREGPPEGAP